MNFKNKIVLDVGSSSGGFSDFALQHVATKVIAVDSGSNQLHFKLRQDKRLELHEKTDIRNFATTQKIDLILIDVSFVSLRQILPSVLRFCGPKTQIVAMVKPQFETVDSMKNSGIVKNEHIRRAILKKFELWVKKDFVIKGKADSQVSGSKGNLERFYLLARL